MDDKYYIRLGSILRKYREDTGMTQEDVGAKLRVSKMKISHIEAGDRKIDAKTFQQYCKLLGVSPDQVYSEAE